MKSTFYVLCIMFLSFVAVRAQQSPQPDPFAGNLFPPEFIMQQQQALGLSEEQVNSLKADLRKTQTRLTELQWALEDEVGKIAGLMKPVQVDESQALTQ